MGFESAIIQGKTRDANSPGLPTIANGMDLQASIGVLLPHAIPDLEAMLAGDPAKDLDTDILNEELGRLPDKPDEHLR